MPLTCCKRPPAVSADKQPRLFLAAFCLALLLCGLYVPQGGAAAYPVQSIVLALPVAEDSQTAALYRSMQSFMPRYASVSLLLHPLPGRGGSYAWNFLKGKSGDGYSLAALTFPSFTLLSFDKKRIFVPEEIVPVALFAYAPNVLWVAADSPFASLEDLVVYARTPGNTLALAGTGRYSDQHMATLIFDRASGVKSLYIPLTGTAESLQAVKAKRVTACWGYALAGSSMSGLRPLAVAAPERSPVMPDVPTFREQRMDIVNGQYFGLGMPAEASDEIREAVSALFLDLFSDKDLQTALRASGFIPRPAGLQDIPAFVGEQQREVEQFLDDYTIFPGQSRREGAARGGQTRAGQP